jgi:hypothetical protein
MARAMIMAFAVILLMSNTSCQTMQGRLNEAARQDGVARAVTPLPDWPAYCAEAMPAVVPKVGEMFRHTQARWEVVRENENKRIEWCAAHYDRISQAYSNRP